jgi:Tfp pilus assembly protein PilO
MNRLPKEKRDKLLLVALGTGVVLAVLYFFVISAQQRSLTDCANKTAVAREKLDKAERWLRMSPGIQGRLATARAEVEAKQNTMAPVDKFKWFYNTLSSFLAQYQVKLIDITREPEVGDVGVLPKFPYQAATFGVKLSARYHDFGTFLADFENHFPYLRVQNLEIEPENAPQTRLKETPRANRQDTPGTLAVTLRVVTLIKPNSSLQPSS